MTAYAHEAEEWRDALRDAPPIDKPSRSDIGDEDRARANQHREARHMTLDHKGCE